MNEKLISRVLERYIDKDGLPLLSRSDIRSIEILGNKFIINESLTGNFRKKEQPIIIKNTKNVFKLMFVSDTHYGSVYDRVDLTEIFYDLAYQENVLAILHGGDLTEGDYLTKKKINKLSKKNYKLTDQELKRKLKVFSYDEQVNYVIEKYPYSSIPTYAVSGNHDISKATGTKRDAVKDISKRRDDIIFAGKNEASIYINGVLIKLIHNRFGVLNRRYEDIPIDKKPGSVLFDKESVKPDLICLGHLHIRDNYQYNGCYITHCPSLLTPCHKQNENKTNGVYLLTLYLDDNGNLVKMDTEFKNSEKEKAKIYTFSKPNKILVH